MTTNELHINDTIAEMQAILTKAGYDLANVDGDYEYNLAWNIVDEGGNLDYYRNNPAALFEEVSVDE